ncbi:hypothetical protein [Nitrosopumilus maritimus]|uniref:Uncharacterized protein n=1 Tax=Nitrosopumilus maritimus (strain SCM1) TaxID=436308 RepID=A9A371_NITMS|nr:hypothetical protein [Nitrosopumilus maritimus]ABX12500.1 hypothetical protein Nmar_0604 [Nitrosopumilus maritimus SCM1]
MKSNTTTKNDSISNQTDDSWIQYKNNLHIQKNKISKEFRCITCKLSLGENQGGAGGHSKSKHKMTLSGEPIQTKSFHDSDSDKNPAPSYIDEIDEELLRRRTATQDFSDDTVESMTLLDVYKDVASGAAKITKDPELQFEYGQLKLRRIIPPDWDFRMWIKMTVDLFNRIHKINIQFTQNLDELSPEQLEWHKLVYQENLEWEYEQEPTS